MTQDLESQLATLRTVVDGSHIAGLVVSFVKCQLCRQQLKYLGFVVDDELGLSPDPDKIQEILEVSSPCCVKKIRRFIGTVCWYS